jgi:hypothetical protein
MIAMILEFGAVNGLARYQAVPSPLLAFMSPKTASVAPRAGAVFLTLAGSWRLGIVKEAAQEECGPRDQVFSGFISSIGCPWPFWLWALPSD